MELPRHIRALLDRCAYPDKPGTVELRQTHISYLFFTSEFVYKVKKPVDFGFLDFTTLEKRRFFAEEEVRLNRRLTEGVYLGVVDITETDGVVQIGGEGKVIDCAVKMRRLAPETMLSELLEKDLATDADITRVATRIAVFHCSVETDSRISAFGRVAAIKKNTDENFAQTLDAVGKTITEKACRAIEAYTDGFLKAHAGLFKARVDNGFIRDCHGDIHSDHISITDRIDIIDCVEFNERFRCSDTVADIAFLAMDLDFLNRADLSAALIGAYFRQSEDPGGMRLLDFYKCYRAYVRGKVEGFKFFEPEVTEQDRRDAFLMARRHFHLALLYATGGFRPMMLIVRGLSGTGKSTVAAALSKKTSMPVLSSDLVRKELAGLGESTHVYTGYKKGIYSEEFTEKTYRALVLRASSLLRAGRSVILDATFSKAAFVDTAAKAAEGCGAEFHIVECVLNETAVKERIAVRLGEESASDARWETYLRQKRAFEPIIRPSYKADTFGPVEGVCFEIIRHIYA